MQIEFVFNRTKRIVLIPETAKDKQLLQLCFGGAQELKLIASKEEIVVLEVYEDDKV